MSSPEPTQDDADETGTEQQVPPANPGYSTPPPDGLPDAENQP